jgi:5-methylcytosine-specific restriction endonuclease McrA
MNERQKRPEVSDALRFEVQKRDNFTCVYCGFNRNLAGKDWGVKNWLEIDHIVPMASGGGHGAENLVVCCYKCNIGKGAVPLWMKILPLRKYWDTRLRLERLKLNYLESLKWVYDEIKEAKGRFYG